jgi:hypothetical protein
MSEEDFRDGLEAALAGEPALNFDADALIERARRQARRRRSLVGAGLASATVAVAAVAVPTILGSPRPVLGAGSDNTDSCGGAPEASGWFSYGPLPETGPPLTTDVPPNASASSAPPSASPGTTTRLRPISSPPPVYTGVDNCPPSPVSSGPPSTPAPPQLSIAWPPTGVTAPNLPKAQVQERADALREYLLARVPVVVTGATKITVAPFTDGVKGTISDGLSYLESDVGYVRDGVTSLVWVRVSAPGETDPTIPDQECGHGINPVCSVVDQPDGSAVVIKLEDLKNLRDGTPIAEPGARQVSATHYRKDGSQISVTTYNIDPLAPGPVRPNVSLTTAELVTLATDPKVTF